MAPTSKIGRVDLHISAMGEVRMVGTLVEAGADLKTRSSGVAPDDKKYFF